MSPISRGFMGRRQPVNDPSRVPPGQYVTRDFPVLSAGPTPHTPLDEWSFTLSGEVDEPVSWTWEEFLALLKEKLSLVEMDQGMMSRALNEGFSGGEKKRNEILQMAVLDPKLAILDETDSGLDIDALRVVATAVEKLRRPDNATILVTHYQRLLNYITPDHVHVLVQGRIVKSGDKDLALALEEKGYDWIREGLAT